jgi:hypothetical protein
MNSKYDIFEKSPDGELLWLGMAASMQEVRRKLAEFGTSTKNELCAIDVMTNETVACANALDAVGANREEAT